jgi:hypothetical protein
MTEELTPKTGVADVWVAVPKKAPVGQPRGTGCRNKTTIAAGALLPQPACTAPDWEGAQPTGEILLQIRCTWREM